MKKYTSEQLQELITNPEQFKREAEESFGYVFACLEKHKIEPTVDFLIETITPYSVRYLTNKFNKEDFTPSQFKIFLSYKEDEDKNEKLRKYSLEDLLSEVNEEKEIDYKVKNSFKLTFEQFKQHKDTLIKLTIDNEFGRNDPILERMFAKITPKQFLSLGKEFLLENPQLFNLNPLFLETSEFKTLYRQAIEIYHTQKRSEGETRPQIDEFHNYKFELIEKPFAEQLLKGGYWNRYRDLSHISGFTNMFSPLEFFEKYDQTDLTILTSKEIADNLGAIQEAFRTHIAKTNRSNWDRLVKLKVTLPDFYAIFSKDCVKEMIKEAEHFRFTHFDRDYAEEKEKSFHITFLAVKILREDPSMLQYISLPDVLGNLHSNIEYNRSSVPEDYLNDIEYILTNHIPHFTNPANLFGQGIKFEMFTENGVLGTILQTHEQPSINYLYFLLQVHENLHADKKGYKRQQADEIVPFITEIASHLNPKEVEKLMSYFNFSYDVNTNPQKALKHAIDDSFNGNLFKYKTVPFESLDDETRLGLLRLDPDFRTYVLENNFSLTRTGDDSRRKDAINFLLRAIDNVDNTFFPFLKQYIAQHNDEFLANYEKEITQHVLLNEFISINNEEKEKINYKNAIPLLMEYTELDSQINKLQEEINVLSDKKEPTKHLRDKRNLISKQVRTIKEEFEPLFGTLSYDFITERVQELLAERNYTTLVPLLKQFRNHTELLKHHIKELPYEDLMKSLSDPGMISFIESQPSYRSHNDPIDAHALFNPSYTYKQNLELAIALRERLNQKDTEGQILKIACLFFSEAKDFVKELVINYAPQEMFYSYNYIFSEKKSSYSRAHTNSFYTNDEIRQGLDNLVKKYGDVLCNFDANADYDTMISSNYLGRNKEYLELVKSYEHDPVIYLLLSAPDNFNQNITTGKDSPYKTRDEAIMNYIKDNFNLEIIKKGIEQLIKKQESFYGKSEGTNKFNASLAEKAISRFFSYSYVHEYHSNGKDRYFSSFSQEESEDLLKFIWNLAPAYVITQSTIGSIYGTTQHIAKNFKDFYYDGLIEDFFLKGKPITNAYFRLDSSKDNYQTKNFSILIDGLISHLIENKMVDEIEQLSYIIAEHEFNEQRSWGKKLEKYNSVILDVFTEIPNFQEYLNTGINMLQLSKELPDKPVQTKKKKI